MRIYSVSKTNYLSNQHYRMPVAKSNINFTGKHVCRNTGLGIGTVISAVGFGLWNIATGGVPLLVSAIALGGTAAAGAFGDAIDKSIEEEEKNKNKK